MSLTWKDVVQPIYDATVRPHLPISKNIHTRANIPIPADKADPIAPRLLDIKRSDPEYKSEFLEAIRTHVDGRDDVGIIGAGRGVSSVVALRQGATVTAYEAAEEMLTIAEKTVDWQGFDGEYELVHGVVGDPIEVYGDRLGEPIHPGDLDHDVLILDCEGSEADIIRRMESIPETLIVETHPERGTPSFETVDAVHKQPLEVVEYEILGEKRRRFGRLHSRKSILVAEGVR